MDQASFLQALATIPLQQNHEHSDEIENGRFAIGDSNSNMAGHSMTTNLIGQAIDLEHAFDYFSEIPRARPVLNPTSTECQYLENDQILQQNSLPYQQLQTDVEDLNCDGLIDNAIIFGVDQAFNLTSNPTSTPTISQSSQQNRLLYPQLHTDLEHLILNGLTDYTTVSDVQQLPSTRMAPISVDTEYHPLAPTSDALQHCKHYSDNTFENYLIYACFLVIETCSSSGDENLQLGRWTLNPLQANAEKFSDLVAHDHTNIAGFSNVATPFTQMDVDFPSDSRSKTQRCVRCRALKKKVGSLINSDRILTSTLV